jgi:hypothetical protein
LILGAGSGTLQPDACVMGLASHRTRFSLRPGAGSKVSGQPVSTGSLTCQRPAPVGKSLNQSLNLAGFHMAAVALANPLEVSRLPPWRTFLFASHASKL